MAAWTLTEYSTLKKAVASGVLRVSYSDRTVQYQTLAEMRELLHEMEQVLGINVEPRYSVLTHSRDLS